MSKFKVGDKVRIVHTDYPDCGLEVGDVHDVVDAKVGGVYIACDGIGDMYFYNREVEPYTDTYTTILEAIAGPDVCAMARKISEALNDAS